MECVNAVVKGQAESTYPMIQISGIPYWLMLSTPNVPVPAYACSADAATSMSLLTADQKPKCNHATAAPADQLGAVHLPGPIQSAAAQPEGVAAMYPSTGPYPGYGHGYGMTRMCIAHSCMHGCFMQSKLTGIHIVSLLSSLVVAEIALHASLGFDMW